MAIDFPASPALNDIYTYSGRSWIWNGSGWAANGTNISATSPLSYSSGVISLGSDIPLSDGGTNASLTAVNGGIVYSTASAMAITSAGTSGQALVSAGASAPVWTTLGLDNLPLAWVKKAVRVATTAALGGTYNNGTAGVGATLTISSTTTLDGVSLNNGDRILVKDQATAFQNGIYTRTSATVLTRALDAELPQEISAAIVAVEEGTANGGSAFTNYFKATDTIGTTSMVWSKLVDTSQFGANVATFLATPTSANLRTAVATTSTGTAGSLVFSTTPTITTPVIDSISASAATGINPSLYSNTTTGNISIGSGLTSGQMNIATGGSSATPISIGHTNATIGLTGNTTVTGTLTSTSTIQGTTGTFTGSTLAINGATPAITSTNTSAASIFTSTVSGVTIGSSTIKTTAYPLAPIGTTSGTVTQSAQLSGYLGMPQNPYVAAGIWAYGIGSLDAGKHIYVTGTPTSATITIPANSSMAFEIGTTIVVMNDLGAATNISIAITTDTLQLAGTGATGTRTLARYGVASMTKVTSTKWIISGNGLT